MSAFQLLHGLVLDDGRRWGAVAVDWQREDARAVLEPADGEPSLHWLGRPKGGSKTTDLAGMSCAWLVEQAPAMAEGFAVAADRDQANRLLNRARAFIARTPGLDEALEVQSHRILHRSSRASVIALEADVASSEGLLTPWVVVDELPNWADTPTARRMWTSVVSAVPKWPGMRLVVIGHAGDPAHWSFGVLEVAKAEGWRVREVPGPLPWVSDADLAMQRQLLLPSEFARRHLNQWTSAEDRLTTIDDVRGCHTHTGPLAPVEGVRYVVTLDVGVTNDRTVGAVTHLERRPDGHYVVLDRMQVWTPERGKQVPFAEVEAWVAESSRAYNRAPVLLDPYQALHIAQWLRSTGVRVEQFNFTQQSKHRLTAVLMQLLRDRLLELPDNDPDLDDELATVRVRTNSAGLAVFDHDSGHHDDRVTALALGCWWHLDRGGKTRRRRSLLVDPPAPAPVGSEGLAEWQRS